MAALVDGVHDHGDGHPADEADAQCGDQDGDQGLELAFDDEEKQDDQAAQGGSDQSGGVGDKSFHETYLTLIFLTWLLLLDQNGAQSI